MSVWSEAQYIIDELSDKINTTGWKLQPPTNVLIKNFDEAAKITWTDPEDIVINGAIAAQLLGTVVVRKEGSAPIDATDGIAVVDSRIRNQYKDSPFVDEGLENGRTYYYGIFPYTYLMQYTVSSITEFSPSEIVLSTPVINSVRAKDRQVVINFTSETEDALVKFVLKIGSEPTSPTDGTVYSDFSESPATITGLVNDTTYFIAAYAYTAKRISGQSNVVSAMPRAYIAFAAHYSENNSSPNSVDYPEGYDNSNFSDTFYVDLTTGLPHYGDWDGDIAKWLIPRSCMLKYDGTVDYYLNEDDETKREDGTASDVANVSYAGNAMVEWGQDGSIIYWKLEPDADAKGFTFVVANAQLDDDMQPWNHYNCKGNVAEHFYTPKYFGSDDGTRLRSISGRTNYVSNTASTELSKAKANNLTADEIWNTEVYSDWILVGMLCMLFSKSLNSQAKFGSGRCFSTNTSAIGQGTMNGKGQFYGSSNQTSGVKVFGMENPWGNIWRRIAGLMNLKGTVKIKMTYGQQDGSSVDGYNTTGNGYITHGTEGNGTSGGYTSHMNITKQGISPNTSSGSDSTFYTDGNWFNNAQDNYARVGGNWTDSGLVGTFCCSLHAAASHVNTGIGAALSCKPLA